MKKRVLLTAAAAMALWCAPQAFAQYSGQAGGMDPSGNSTFGGGSAMTGHFGDYATALRLIRDKQFEDAIPYLNRALSDRPHSADILDNLGYAHRMIGDFPGARDYLQKAIAINADHQGAHEHLGELDLAMHDPASADAQLAELTRICTSGCDEKDALAKAIAAYRAEPVH